MKRKQKRLYFWVWKQFRQRRAFIYILCGSMALLSFIQVATAAVTRLVIDAGVAGDPALLWMGISFAVLLLIQVLIRSLSGWIAGGIADRSAATLRYMILRAAERSSGERLRQFHSGTLLNRSMEDVNIMCDAVTNLLPTLSGNLVRLLGAFGLLLYFYPVLALLLSAMCGMIGLGVLCLRPKLRRSHKAVRQADEASLSAMQEFAQQIELVQALGAEEESLRRLECRLKVGIQARRHRRKWVLSGSSALSLGMQMLTGGMLLWGVYEIGQGKLSYGILTMLLQLLSLFFNPALSLSGLWGKLASLEVSGERLRELLETEEDSMASEMELQQGEAPEAIVFDDVTFRYKPEEAPVLEHYTARIDLADWSCLIGDSGQGKSTIFKLILGIHRPQSGRVYLEIGQRKIPCGPETRMFFAYVPQDYTLFSGSILENLRLVKPEATCEECAWALRLAQADFVWELSEGVDTEIKEQRTGLSMGQLQRIAIARAILMDRPFFLLDECTSSLDQQTELSVLKALNARKCGAILATHRPEALACIKKVQYIKVE